MDVAIIPCADRTGRNFRESPNVDYPEELVGRNIYFDFHIISCKALPQKFKVQYSMIHESNLKSLGSFPMKDLHCKYCFYGEKVDTSTEMHPFNSSIMFDHNRIICYEPASREVLLANIDVRASK